jgi:hypothetical protein
VHIINSPVFSQTEPHIRFKFVFVLLQKLLSADDEGLVQKNLWQKNKIRFSHASSPTNVRQQSVRAHYTQVYLSPSWLHDTFAQKLRRPGGALHPPPLRIHIEEFVRKPLTRPAPTIFEHCSPGALLRRSHPVSLSQHGRHHRGWFLVLAGTIGCC